MWDFRGANTKEYTHCFHNYPAMMIPQIARELLNRYGIKNGSLLDPYCGTGTSLVESSLFGMNSVGCDINPLARLLSSSKTTTISIQKLDSISNDLNDYLYECMFTEIDPSQLSEYIPDVLNIDYWFEEDTKNKLAIIRKFILSYNENETKVRNFLWSSFSETVRECSYTRNSEFKLYRMAKEKMKDFTPDVFDIFQKKIKRNMDGLKVYMKNKKDVDVVISDSNTSKGEFPSRKPDGGFDLVITSPPYGDSQTTVAYGQFSRLSSDWIGLPNSRKIDGMCMGGDKHIENLNSFPTNKAIKNICSVDEKRSKQVESFYTDLKHSINTVASLLSETSIVCYVVGNRRVKGFTLPTDEFVAYAFSLHGFSHKETIVRNIPNKRMPKKNSPTNVTGKTDTTMNEEYIVICQRQL
jgi:site-specific DNA-methyltransferase (cytosine-N4-specific)